MYIALRITNPEVEQKVRNMASICGESITEAIGAAADERIAREAFRCFGKGRDRAGLNYGVCFSYALARQTGESLLLKGNDFTHTDLAPA